VMLVTSEGRSMCKLCVGRRSCRMRGGAAPID
jgi:hypothetical protein